MIKLMMVANPDVNDGKPTGIFININNIALVYTGLGSYQQKGQRTSPVIECTHIAISDLAAPTTLMVQETAEQVIALMEREKTPNMVQ